MSGAPPRLPRLRPTLERVVTADGRLLLAGGPEGDVHELEGDAAQLAAALARLAGPRPGGQIAALPGTSTAELIEAVEELAAAGLVDDAAEDRRFLSERDLERFDRQLRYFG